MNKSVNFVNLLSKEQFLKDVTEAAVSPLLNLICLVSKQKEASVYQLPCNGDEVAYWQCTSKTKKCLFSEDGRFLLFLLSVNTIQIYKMGEQAVTQLLQIKASVLAELFKEYNIDYSSVSKVAPLRLHRSELFVKVDNRLVCLEWGIAGNDPTVRYTILLPATCDINLSKNKLFLLEPNAHLNIYNLSNGHKNPEVLNLCLANRANADISIGRSFSKFSIDSSGVILAVVNQDQVTTLFDISEAFDNVDRLEEPKKEKWTWPGKRKSVSDARGFPGKVLGQVQPLSGVVVTHLQFSLHGLFIFYSVMGSESYSGFKVVDEMSGNVFCTTDGLVEYSLIPGGSLPLFMSHSIICICLGALSFDPFVSTLCKIIPGFNPIDFEKNSNLSLNEHFQVYSEIMKITFSLHSNTFRAHLKKLSSCGWRDEAIERKLIERVEILCNLALAEVRDDRVVKFVFLHMVHLLDLTCLMVKTTRAKSSLARLENLATVLTGHLVELYRVIQHLDLFSYEWMVWRGLSDQEVVQEAVVIGTVALALTFFTCERNWDVSSAIEKFKNATKDFVAQLISVGDLEKATLALNTLGCDPLEHFRELCLENNEPLLRDLLIQFLRKAERVSEEEESAWKFCKQVESSLSTFVKTYRHFEHKMIVSATECATIIMIKLIPFKGSLDLKTVLKQSIDWRKAVITELYFVTGDVTLESQLDMNLCWIYLLEKNCIDLLINWIDVSYAEEKPQPMDYLTKMLLAFLSRWPVTPQMLDNVNNADCMAATRSAVLDRSAHYGVFSTTESQDISLVVHRLRNVCLLSRAMEILTKPTSNVSLGDFYSWIMKESSKHGVKIPVISCLESANQNGELDSGLELFPWLPVWRKFGKWDGVDSKILAELIDESIAFVNVSVDEAPLLKIASALARGKEVVEILEEEGESCSLLQIPPIDICWQSLQRARTRPPDVTIYDLMAGSKLPVDRLFAWQSENTYNKEPNMETFPHFNHQVLSAKLGHKQSLDYLYYLKQGQPSVACNLFTVESLRTHRRISPQMINRACGLAHGLAIRLWRDQIIGTACVAFIAMLGEIPMANALRLHLGVISLISEYLPPEKLKFIGFLTFGIVSKDVTQLQDMANLLELALLKAIMGLDKIAQMRKWSIAVTFCNLHGLPMPTLLPRAFAKEGDWFNFILCLDLFKYSYEVAIELVEGMDHPVLKAHFLRALTRTTLKLATTSPSKSPPRIHMDPDSGTEDEMNDAFHAYVDSIYSEVLTTIQSFTDRNIVLPWSCEQNPDDDVLLTLLKYESEPDTSNALLLAALELQSPILALFSTCYQVENVAAPLIAWLLASVPTSLPRSRLREDGQLLPLDRNFNPELVQNLFIQFFSTGYFQTFYRGMILFLPDNPLTFLIEAVYRCVVEMDTPGALNALKNFVSDHGQSQVKDSPLAARDWVLKTAYRLIESILTRQDVPYSIKLAFLSVLADSEIASVDEAFPKFFLWHQISEILEPTKVQLRFSALYDLQTVSAEMERCLDELFSARAFSAALEISALLSLNKDRIVVAIWEQHFNESVNGDVSKLWTESSVAFKDENVNPMMVSAFYYKMTLLFSNETTDCLRSKYLALKYCLAWRKLVEDTLLPSFREESDTIELEQWETCLKDDFDYSVFKSENAVEDFAVMVSQWPPPKLLVRAPVSTAPEPNRVSKLIAALLDAGDLRSALRVSAFFSCDDQDLVTISSCLQVALGELPASELAQYSSMLSHPRKLLTPAMEVVGTPEGLETPPGREPPPILGLLERLCSSVAHGYALAQRICVCVRLSFAIDVRFLELAGETNFLELLERAIGTEYGTKLAVARDVLWLSGLPDTDLAQYLTKRIIRAISDWLMTGLDVPARLWDINLEDSFHRIISLMANPAVLGQELLNASYQLQDAEAVEILIRAHDCYTVACNVEGIGLILRRARRLAMQILQTHQERLLVRLLVGIGRYGDMGYIFQMLKDNEEFEHLLRKGAAKAPGLSIAVSDFLQRTCPEQRRLGKMVALVFGLHGHHAAIWLEEAEEIISQLKPPLKDSSKIRQELTLAMENYSNASAYFLEAGKVDKALKVAKLAQIVAMQISMLGGNFIININQQQLQNLAQENLSVDQIIFLSDARKLRIDWCAVIHDRWVLHGEKAFFNDLKSHGILEPSLISHYLQRYEKDAEQIQRAKDRVKQLTSLLPTNSIFFKHLKSQ